MHNKVGVLLLLLFLALTASAVAQNRQGSAASRPQSSVNQVGPITVRGCVSGGKEAYTLSQSSTGTMFQLQGESNQFEQLRGKQVEVKGRELPPGNGIGLQALPKLLVATARVLGDQCPFRAHAGAPAATPTNIPQNPPAPSSAPTAATPRYSPNGAPNQMPPNVNNNPNIQGANGAPSPGTGNPPPQKPPR